MDISVVLPCLNEEEAIAAVVADALRGIRDTGLTGEVVVVDNGSTDRSAEIAHESGARVIAEPRRGYGSAYLAGLNAARGEYIVLADADLTYPVEQLLPFIEAFRAGNDFVMGSRLRGKIEPGAMPWLHRWIGNPVLTRLFRLFFRLPISDAYCGMRAVRRSVLPRMQLQALGMEFAGEMLIKAAKCRLPVAEVPIEYRSRRGESKLHSFRDGWRFVRLLLVHSPTWCFLVPGFVLFVPGAIVLGTLSGGPVELFGQSWQIHAMIFASTATLVGAQIVQLGLFARSYAVLYLGDREPRLERYWLRIRLEHGLLLGGVVLAAGVAVLAIVFGRWAADDFGRLSQEHPALLGLTLVGLGTQIVFGSFFISILGLSKHLVLPGLSAARVEPTETAVRES